MVAEVVAGPGRRQGPCPSQVWLLWSSLGLQARPSVQVPAGSPDHDTKAQVQEVVQGVLQRRTDFSVPVHMHSFLDHGGLRDPRRPLAGLTFAAHFL